MAAPEPIELTDGAWYLPGAVNTFIIRAEEGGAIVVDTGLDKDYARNLLRASRGLGLEPRFIINTHAHADHCGGNAWLLARLEGATVMAPPFESVLIRNPELEPFYLYAGALPLRELTGKWTQAEPSPVHAEAGPGRLVLGGVELELLAVPGHAREQLAVRFRDLLIAADALAGPELLARYPLTFSHDPAQHAASARTLRDLAGIRVAVPGHGQPTGDLAALVGHNLAALARVRDAVLAAADGVDQIEVLVRVAAALEVAYEDPVRFHLNLSTVMAWLSSLRTEGLLECGVAAGRLLWRRAQGARRRPAR